MHLWLLASFLASAAKVQVPVAIVDVFGCVEGKESEWDDEWHEIMRMITDQEIQTPGVKRIIYSHGEGGSNYTAVQTRQLFIQFDNMGFVREWKDNIWPVLYKKAAPLEEPSIRFEYVGLNWIQFGNPRHDQHVRVVAYHLKDEHEHDMVSFAYQWSEDQGHRAGFTFFSYAQSRGRGITSSPIQSRSTVFVETFDTREHLDKYVKEVTLTGHEGFLAHPEGLPFYSTATEIIQVVHGIWEERDIYEVYEDSDFEEDYPEHDDEEEGGPPQHQEEF